MPGKPLCDDQILEAIDIHWRENLYPPSIQYIIENSCVKSKNTVWLALRRLEKRDEIYLVPTVEGYKAYMKWAWHALNSRAKQVEENESKPWVGVFNHADYKEEGKL